jgi:hypothetical protein
VRFKKFKIGCFYGRFFSAVNLLKQPLRLADFFGSSVDENLKSQPKKFWKYVSKLRRKVGDYNLKLI